MALEPKHHALLIALGHPTEDKGPGLPPSVRPRLAGATAAPPAATPSAPAPPDVQPKPQGAVDQGGIQGEPGTGYEGSDNKGEFECQNCSHMEQDTGTCNEPHMVKLSKQPRGANGNPQVDPEGCCEYVDRVGQQAGGEEKPGGALVIGVGGAPDADDAQGQ